MRQWTSTSLEGTKNWIAAFILLDEEVICDAWLRYLTAKEYAYTS